MSETHPTSQDHIPWLPLPQWLERAIVEAIRILVAAALQKVAEGNPDGKSNL